MIVVHGAFGGADTWALDLERRVRSLYGADHWDIVRLDWLEISRRYLSAMRNGHALGEAIGAELASSRYSYETLHLVGSSMGAHVVEGIATGYRDTHGETGPAAFLHMTYLDPFGLPGQFGSSADFAEVYYTADDRNMPFTNRPVPLAYNFELSSIVPEKEDPHYTYVHDFPTLHYVQSVGARGPGFALSPIALESVPGVTGTTLSAVLTRGAVRVVRSRH